MDKLGELGEGALDFTPASRMVGGRLSRFLRLNAKGAVTSVRTWLLGAIAICVGSIGFGAGFASVSDAIVPIVPIDAVDVVLATLAKLGRDSAEHFDSNWSGRKEKKGGS